MKTINYLLFCLVMLMIVVASSCNDTLSDTDFEVNGVKFRMIAVEGGSFMMGATPEQGDAARENEKPAHKVTVDDFYIGETEVTQKLWFAVMGNNPSYFQDDDGNRPVENVSWNDAQEFIKGLNEITGRQFRLPFEAEWEYAARGGRKTTNKMYAGSDDLSKVAWYVDNSGNCTHLVAEKLPNELGLYGMSGNVWEWCDCIGDPINLLCNLRGGSFGNDSIWLRTSSRYISSADNRNIHIGFRIVLIND